MKVLIHATSLNSAGGLSVGINFLKALNKNNDTNFYHVLAPPSCGYKNVETEKIKVQEITYYSNLFFRYIFDHFLVKQKIKSFNPDVIFSMGNIALPVKGKQLLLYHWPYAAYPESVVWGKMSLKERLLRKLRLSQIVSKFKYADVIAVQTETIKKRLDTIYKVESKTIIIPNAVSLPPNNPNAPNSIPPNIIPGYNIKRKYLLCLSRYYIHKNLEVLLEVGKLLKINKSNISILLTIEQDQGKGAGYILKEIKKHGLEDFLVNIGKVDMSIVPHLYSISDGMILPTLLESYSGTYIESMNYEKPIFTSNLDFAVEVCKDAAFYFNPHDPIDIYTCISNALQNEQLVLEKITAGKNRVGLLPNWETVAQMYLEALSNVSK